ncbi:hypothetical protein SAY87_032188 [Trapa incisa]|uniref:KHG/KDPG aldolase n=2 Tax=Trapa TaxID=22665 RepID=A0AAN7MLF1_TRANT|nr:hypothetical protein SAY87_032188 [Trapa incisa]KAK4797121.1 hypothetical protein SAY86_029447 [Trapa natans]
MATTSNSFCSPPLTRLPLTELARPLPHRMRVRCFSSSPLSRFDAGRTLAQIQNSGVIACLRANSPELAMEAARAALGAGVSVLEIVMSTPGVLEVLEQLVLDYPAAVLGVGTVLNVKDASIAMSVGARFLMSPAIVEGIMADVQNSNVLYIPGVMTPNEILLAYNAGAKIVKVYPVSALGGVNYISAIQKPFSHIPMVASQGIAIESTDAYIAQGASAVVLSEAIFNSEAMSQHNFDLIYELAKKASLLGSEAVDRKKRWMRQTCLQRGVSTSH